MPFSTRTRISPSGAVFPRVMAGCRTQRAVDSLLLGLADTRFEVRFQCGRSLTAITGGSIRTCRSMPTRIFDVVRREVAVGRPVWEGRRLLDRLDDGEAPTFVDEFIRMRASQSLAHVFTLLSLVLPSEPLQIAFRGLHADDQDLRGTALEYLEERAAAGRSRAALAVPGRSPAAPPGPRAAKDILADLVRSNHSIMLNLEELKRRARQRTATADTRPRWNASSTARIDARRHGRSDEPRAPARLPDDLVDRTGQRLACSASSAMALWTTAW